MGKVRRQKFNEANYLFIKELKLNLVIAVLEYSKDLAVSSFKKIWTNHPTALTVTKRVL